MEASIHASFDNSDVREYVQARSVCINHAPMVMGQIRRSVLINALTRLGWSVNYPWY